MVDSARRVLNDFLPDVYIYTDVVRGKEAGRSVREEGVGVCGQGVVARHGCGFLDCFVDKICALALYILFVLVCVIFIYSFIYLLFIYLLFIYLFILLNPLLRSMMTPFPIVQG